MDDRELAVRAPVGVAHRLDERARRAVGRHARERPLEDAVGEVGGVGQDRELAPSGDREQVRARRPDRLRRQRTGRQQEDPGPVAGERRAEDDVLAVRHEPGVEDHLPPEGPRLEEESGRRRVGGGRGAANEPGRARAERERGDHRRRPEPARRRAPRGSRRRARRRRGLDRRARRLLELEREVARVAPAPLRIALQAAVDHPPQPGRRLQRQRREVELGAQHAREQIGDGLAGEESAPGQHLPEHDAERPEVGAAVERPAARLLGGHVGGGAEDDPLDGAVARDRGRVGEIARGRLLLPGLGEPEVEHLDGAVGPEPDVGRLQVAVEDALVVRGGERGGDLRRDRRDLVGRDRAAPDPLVEPLALDQLHDQRKMAVERLEPEQRGDVRMVERGEQPRLALEAGAPLGVGRERLGQQLQRHLAPEPRVAGAVDLAHAATAEQGGDLELGDRPADQ